MISLTKLINLLLLCSILANPSTPAEPTHYDFTSDAMVKQGGQSDHTVRREQAYNLQHDSNRTVQHQSRLKLAPNSKQATPIPPLTGIPTMDFRDTRDLTASSPAVVTDELMMFANAVSD
jgi:hypothetical protein